MHIKHQSLRKQISNCSLFELDNIAKYIIKEWEKLPRCLYFDLKHRIQSGAVIFEETHAELVILSMSPTLYKSRKFFNMEALQKLLIAGVPDIYIETTIVERLCDDFRKKSYGNLINRLDILREYGSNLSLKELEVLNYDLSGENFVLKLKNSIENYEELNYQVDFQRYSEHTITNLNTSLFDLLIKTIKKLRQRNSLPQDYWQPWSTL
jgi:hypothetical protein